MIWKFRAREFSFDCPHLMGVLNLTFDSFSDGGKYTDPAAATDHACQMIEDGADLIDLGAESTRPGAEPVSSEIQISKLIPVVREIRKRSDIPLSIDTTRGEVARACILEGADIINDVSGLEEDGAQVLKVALEFQTGLILMHRRGNAKTMQDYAEYDDVAGEVIAELSSKVQLAEAGGAQRDYLMIDPGLGFSKTAEQNIELMQNLEKMAALDLPVLLGPSRKSFLGQLTGREVDDREFATAACGAWAFLKNIQMLRVHEIKPMKDVIKVLMAFSQKPQEIKETVHVRT